MSENHNDKVMTKAEVVQLMQLWESKGHSVLSVVRVFTLEDGRVLIGFTDYGDPDQVVFAGHMYKPYANYQGAFTALGAMFDALEAANVAIDEQIKSRESRG